MRVFHISTTLHSVLLVQCHLLIASKIVVPRLSLATVSNLAYFLFAFVALYRHAHAFHMAISYINLGQNGFHGLSNVAFLNVLVAPLDKELFPKSYLG